MWVYIKQANPHLNFIHMKHFSFSFTHHWSRFSKNGNSDNKHVARLHLHTLYSWSSTSIIIHQTLKRLQQTTEQTCLYFPVTMLEFLPIWCLLLNLSIWLTWVLPSCHPVQRVGGRPGAGVYNPPACSEHPRVHSQVVVAMRTAKQQGNQTFCTLLRALDISEGEDEAPLLWYVFLFLSHCRVHLDLFLSNKRFVSVIFSVTKFRKTHLQISFFSFLQNNWENGAITMTSPPDWRAGELQYFIFICSLPHIILSILSSEWYCSWALESTENSCDFTFVRCFQSRAGELPEEVRRSQSPSLGALESWFHQQQADSIPQFTHCYVEKKRTT